MPFHCMARAVTIPTLRNSRRRGLTTGLWVVGMKTLKRVSFLRGREMQERGANRGSPYLAPIGQVIT
jgi:hypothetical protein